MKNNLNEKLEYDAQLEFKRYARKALKLGDCFYFDSVYGVDGRTQHDIKGLKCDGSITWKKALSILNKHFKAA